MAANVFERMWRFLIRMDVASILMLSVSLLAALGSCFPQQTTILEADPERLALWHSALRSRYGAIANVLITFNLFNLFRSPIFAIILVLTSTSTLICTLERWRTVWRRVFTLETRCPEITYEIADLTAHLTAPTNVDVSPALEDHLRQSGFRTLLEKEGGNIYMRGDRNRLTPLATLLTHLAVLLLLFGATLSVLYAWREVITVPPHQFVSLNNERKLSIRNDGFIIERYSDGSAADYEAQVTMALDGVAIKRGSIRLNDPLNLHGISLFLQGYAEADGNYSVVFLAVDDPGYALAILAGFLLLFGLTVSFNFPHCCIYAHLEDGNLRLAGRADRRASDFHLEFNDLVASLAQEIEGQ